MSNEDISLTIGGLARAAGVGVETVRYYQRRGLLAAPARPFGGVRRYQGADLARLRFVKTAQKLGFSLDEVLELLYLEDGVHCDQAGELAERKLSDVRVRIERLRRIEKVLAELVCACHANRDHVSCPLIASLKGNLSELESPLRAAPR